MDGARQHLLRVSDIIGELDGRLRSLRLQAAKAERYKRYKAELKDLDLWAAAQRFLGHLAEEKSLVAQIEDLRVRHDDGARALEVEEGAVEVERLSVTEEMNELGAAKDDLFALSNKAQLGLQRAQHQEDEAGQLSARASSERREIEDLTERLARSAEAIEELEGQLARLDEDAAQSGEHYRVKAEAHDELRVQLGDARRQLDVALGEVAAARARIARNEAEKSAASARREDLGRRIEAIVAEDAAASERLAVVATDADGLRASLSEMQSRGLELGARKHEQELILGALRADVSRGEMELETLREEAHRRR